MYYICMCNMQFKYIFISFINVIISIFCSFSKPSIVQPEINTILL